MPPPAYNEVTEATALKDHAGDKKVYTPGTHYYKSQIFVQKFNFDKTPTLSRVFHPIFFWQFFSWNQSWQQLKSPKPQHFYEFFKLHFWTEKEDFEQCVLADHNCTKGFFILDRSVDASFGAKFPFVRKYLLTWFTFRFSGEIPSSSPNHLTIWLESRKTSYQCVKLFANSSTWIEITWGHKWRQWQKKKLHFQPER